MSIKCVVVICYALLLLWSSCCDVSMGARVIPSSAPSTLVRPLVAEVDQDLVSLRPRLNPGRKQFFRAREIKGCLPKGLRHTSAPSRFVNFHSLGWAGCSSTRESHSNKKP